MIALMSHWLLTRMGFTLGARICPGPRHVGCWALRGGPERGNSAATHFSFPIVATAVCIVCAFFGFVCCWICFYCCFYCWLCHQCQVPSSCHFLLSPREQDASGSVPLARAWRSDCKAINFDETLGALIRLPKA
ncbi:unnamed protein product [Symbiodinium microadriaticum]|nr:unnamed protein product [Symbiodinium sp. KB8]CAE7863251.1 unnamed protein product [Symbiodinium microadriaticum]